jgi:hypothetical protein
MSDDTEQFVKLELMKMDLQLKTKQAFWETPRNIAILLGSVAAVCSLVSGYLGYKAGSEPQRIIVQYLPAPK